MGLVKAEIQIINLADQTLHEEGYLKEEQIRSVQVVALVDSGAIMLAINEEVKAQLGAKVRDKKTAQLADGTVKIMDVVGPLEVRFKNRKSTCNAMVLPGSAEILLGAIPMEDMDVLIHPASQQLIVNPDHPNVAQMTMK